MKKFNLSHLASYLWLISTVLSVINFKGQFFKKSLNPSRGFFPCFLPILFVLLGLNRAVAQCGSATAAAINWDLHYFQVNPPSGTDFMFGVNSMKLGYTITMNGVNSTNTAAGISYGGGNDMQFTAGNTQTITLTFVDELQNVKFSLHDIDNALGVTVTAANAASVAQTVTMAKLSGTVLTVTGATATTTNTPVGNSSTDGTLNIDVAGPVKTITLTFAKSSGTDDIWLSDISGCVTGNWATSYQAISTPDVGLPQYLSASYGNGLYSINMTTGAATLIYQDAALTSMNSVAYDPYNQVFYYCESTGATTNKSVYKYEVKTQTRSVFITDITTLGMQLSGNGLGSGGATFYNGSLFIGQDIKSGGGSEAQAVWRIDINGSGVATRASRFYGRLGYSGTNILYDWADFTSNNGVLYNFNAGANAAAGTNIEHYDMNTQTVLAGYTESTRSQAGIGYDGNIYNFNASGYSLYNGTGGFATATTITGATGAPTDASESFKYPYDYGDSPISYSTAPHLGVSGSKLKIGTVLDYETATNPTSGATGDDGATSDDEDGISSFTALSTTSTSYSVTVAVTNSTGANATLYGWIDFNGNGVFDTGERSTATTVSNGATSVTVSWSGLSGLRGGATFARFRLATVAVEASSPTDLAYSGEVEDYPITITCVNPTTSVTATETSCTTDDDKILSGASVNLSASGTGTFAWDNGLGAGSSKTVSPTATTTYNVTLTDANGCTATAIKTITIITTPSTSVTATETSCTTDDDKILSGASVNLSASGTGTFAWDNGLGAGSSKTVSPTVTTTYNVTLTDANGCTATASKTITIITTPSTSVTATETSCTTDDDKILSGASVNLSASGTGTFAWDNGLGAGSSKTVSPTVTTTYNVTLTDANGCTATASKTITVVSAPTAIISITGSSTINIGESKTLNASGGLSYEWNTTETTTSISVTPSVTTTYTVTATSSDGCIATQSQIITVNQYPVLINQTVSTTENTPLTGSVIANASDSDGNLDANSFVKTDNTTNGTFVLSANGTYTYTPNLNFNGTDSVHYKVCDALGLCDTATLIITVNLVNSAPVAVNDSTSTNEDVAVSGTVATNDSDIENDPLTFTAVTSVPLSAGVLVLNTNGSYTFTPAANFNGVVNVDYQVCDAVLCDTATLTITVSPVNDAPVAVNDSTSTNEDVAVSGTVATNDSDIENDPLTFTAVTSVPLSAGVLVLNTNGSYTFTPAANFNGVVNVDYQVCDAVLCDTATLTITVSPVNDAPVAVNDSTSTNEDVAVSGTVATNDSDIENDPLTFTAVTSVPLSAGVLVLNANGSYTFTPAANFNGVVNVDYKVCDATLCDTATLTITVNPVNDAPVAVNDSTSTNEDVAVSGTVATNDSDIENDPLTFTAITNVPVGEGVLVLNTNGSYTFTPAANFNGVVSVSYQVCDATLCDTATLTITVSPVNDAPVAVNDSTSTNEDVAVSGTVAINDSDIENDPLTYTTVTSVPLSEGVLVLNANGSYTFTPAANFNGVVNVDYQVCDATLCDTATLTITVNAVNDAPIAVNDSTSTNEDVVVSGTVATNDSDIENDPLTFTAVTSVPASKGVLVLNANGSYTFTPAANFSGVVSFSYQVCDATLCDTATLTITVNAVNDSPVAVNDSTSINEDVAVSGTVATNDSDTEGDTLTYTAVTSVPTSKGVLVLNANGSYTFTPALNFNGVVNVSYQVCDAVLCDTATLTITVSPVNDGPVAVNDSTSTTEDVAVSGTVASNDSDTEGDALTFTAVTSVPLSAGVLVLNANGSYTFTPALNFNGVVNVDYKVCDATLCDTATLTITVSPINDAPVAVNDSTSTNEDVAISGTVASNDSDTEGDALTFTAVTSVPLSKGVLVLNANGSYIFTPAANFNGVVNVDYQVCDATLCDTATLTITVSPVNDAPVAVNDSTSTNEDVAVSGTVATNDSDIENDPLTFTAVTSVPLSKGVLVLNTNGSYTFTPAANFNGVVNVDYKVCDATLCDTATLTITVSPVNDAPIAVNDSTSTNEDVAVSGTVASNDSDTEGDALTFTAVASVPASKGVLVLNANGSYTFTPALNFNGVVNVDYQVCDATLCDTATLTITVNPVNDAPVAVNDVVTTLEDVPVSNTVATNDSDIDNLNNELTYTAITSVPASEGVLVFNSNGSYTFTPALNFNGVGSVSYKVCDLSGVCDTATLIINITSVNNAPIAVNDVETTNEDTAISSTVATNDSDIEGNNLSFATIGGIPVSQGVLVLNADGTYTFTPAPNFSGVVSVDYKVCDFIGACDTATLTITVNTVNDAPIAVNDANSTLEDTATSGTVATNDSDVENELLTFTSITNVQSSQGILTLNNNGTYTFVPASNFNGIVTVDYKVCDASGACDTAILTITVTPVNDAPVAVNDTATSSEDVVAKWHSSDE